MGKVRPEWPCVNPDRDSFIAGVLEQGRARYRDFPWRNIDDPYAVLVSEIMLQQTQVKRVRHFWERFLGQFPTVDALASADVSDVLVQWQGLGYNRRALALKKTADLCAAEHKGVLPCTVEELKQLPGIGPATAAGVVSFAHNRPSVYLETNVRTVFLHELYPTSEQVKDRTLEPLVKDTCPEIDARRWYYALLDYGAYLKTLVVNPSRRSAHYARQSVFEGSRRQKRAALVRIVLACSEGVSLEEAIACLSDFEEAAGRGVIDGDLFNSLVHDLTSEGFFTCEEGILHA